MSPEQKRRQARHARRAANRKAQKDAAPTPAPPAGIVHTEFKPISHPTWDRLLDRIGPELKYWFHGLVLQPNKRQPPLLLTGPECSGKHTLQEAMGLLLPDRAVVRYPPHNLQSAWLMVVEGNPERFVGLIRRPLRCENRYLKLCLTYTQHVEVPGVEHFKLELLATTVPKSDLFKWLNDERDAFQRTLARCKVAA